MGLAGFSPRQGMGGGGGGPDCTHSRLSHGWVFSGVFFEETVNVLKGLSAHKSRR